MRSLCGALQVDACVFVWGWLGCLIFCATDCGTWVLPERYEGDLNSAGCRHGMGKLYYSNGDIYTGEWKEGQRHGEGSHVYALTMKKYEGQWSGDVWCGRGTLTRADGSTLEGSFQEGRLHGVSKLTTPEGITVEAAWVDGKFFSHDVRIVWPLDKDAKDASEQRR